MAALNKNALPSLDQRIFVTNIAQIIQMRKLLKCRKTFVDK